LHSYVNVKNNVQISEFVVIEEDTSKSRKL